jgi:ParB-like nuclease domain
MNWSLRYAKDDPKKSIIEQLEDDFPEQDLDWVRKASWSGPTEVDPKDIDTSNRKSWAASHEPDRVKTRKKRIKKGKIKPILLVKTPKNKKYIIIDGHHRFIAYEQLDRHPICWIGKVDSERGPWDTFHNEQNRVEDEDK